jgi:hypothetical protein
MNESAIIDNLHRPRHPCRIRHGAAAAAAQQPKKAPSAVKVLVAKVAAISSRFTFAGSSAGENTHASCYAALDGVSGTLTVVVHETEVTSDIEDEDY